MQRSRTASVSSETGSTLRTTSKYFHQRAVPSASLSALARRFERSKNRFSALLTGGSLTVCDEPEGVAEPDDPASNSQRQTYR